MKTVCIYHSRDLDGWMSAAIVKLRYSDVEFIGWDYGHPIPDLTGYDKVIMCDVSFPLANMDLIASGVELIQRDFIWIDHHASAIKDCSFEVDGKYVSGYGGIRDSSFAACELTWKYFFPGEPMPELVRLLGRYDCFGHKGTAEELKVLQVQYGAREAITDVKSAYNHLVDESNAYTINDTVVDILWSNGAAIYKYLCTEAKQIYGRKFDIVLDTRGNENRDWTKSDKKYKFACVNQERFNPINFGINYHLDGYDGFACFHYQNGKWQYSLYNDNSQVDCSIIAKSRGGGGHKGASGFRSDTVIL